MPTEIFVAVTYLAFAGLSVFSLAISPEDNPLSIVLRLIAIILLVLVAFILIRKGSLKD